MEKPPSIWDAALQVVKPVLKIALLAGAVYLGMSMLAPAIGTALSGTTAFTSGVFSSSGALGGVATGIAEGLGSATTFLNGLFGTTWGVATGAAAGTAATFGAPAALGVVAAAGATGLGVAMTKNLRSTIVDNVTYWVSSDGPIMGAAGDVGQSLGQGIKTELSSTPSRPSYQFDNPEARSGHADRVMAERAASMNADRGVA